MVLKKELLQQPGLSYGDTVAVAQQLDLVIQVSSDQVGSQINQATSSSVSQSPSQSSLIGQMMANMEVLTEKVNQLSESVARVNAIPAGDFPRTRRGSCFRCGNRGHFASACRASARERGDYRQRGAENCFVLSSTPHQPRQRNLPRADQLLGRGSAHDDMALRAIIICTRIQKIY